MELCRLTYVSLTKRLVGVGLAHGAVSYDIISSLVGSSTTSGVALVGTFLSGSVWSNRSQLTHMGYGVIALLPPLSKVGCWESSLMSQRCGALEVVARGQLGGAEFNRSEHRPVKAEAAGSSPVSPDARFKKCVTPDCESHRHTRAWNYTLEEVSQSLPFALAFLHLMHLGKEAKLFKSE
ncbi:hypothetical protein Tco_0108844 [Tanacetum coccineum]